MNKPFFTAEDFAECGDEGECDLEHNLDHLSDKDAARISNAKVAPLVQQLAEARVVIRTCASTGSPSANDFLMKWRDKDFAKGSAQ